MNGRAAVRLVAVFCAIIFGAACSEDPPAASDSFEYRRAALVAELRREGIRDESVLNAMASTPRHLFVPMPMQPLAYRNEPLPIGHDQTISQPYIVAIMTELALGGKSDTNLRVLEIGTGSGYQAAVLAELVKEVFTIEIIPALALSAEARLNKMGYRNITVRAGDGYKGWPEKAPFDVIVVTAAPPEIPQELVRQLAPRGRMVLPVGETSEVQMLALVEKSDTGEVSTRPLIPVRFVPMVHGDKK